MHGIPEKEKSSSSIYESESGGEDYSDEGHEQVQYGHLERGKEGRMRRLAAEGRVQL
jgi:hypothetical protein